MITQLTMLALGGFRFGVNTATYQALQRTAAYRWATLDRAGRDPAAQYLGPGVETITLNGVIYPHFKGGLRQVEAMRLSARLGEPLILVDGLGFALQRWVILRVTENKRTFLRDGAPRRIDFSVELQSYGEDGTWPSI
jgi:phage protein U